MNPDAIGRWQRLRRRHPGALIAGAVLLLLALASLIVPALSPYDYYTPQLDLISRPPALHGGHLLGTDPLGRDLLIRVLWGCRISLLIGIAASAISVLVGVLWGAVAGYAGGVADAFMMRTVDVLYSVPFVPFVIVLTVLFGHDLWLIFIAIGAVSWLDIARIVRGEALALKRREFVEAARASGVRAGRMIAHHIVPNLLGVVIIYATLTIPAVILFEAFMSFLGLGVRAPLASLGSLIADGASDMQAHPHLLLVPAVVLATIVYCFNFIGDGLRDALDPHEP
ncbi:MAG TPA: ABC transporter permease subunit [Steroidobacteraceae bacterium]